MLREEHRETPPLFVESPAGGGASVFRRRFVRQGGGRVRSYVS